MIPAFNYKRVPGLYETESTGSRKNHHETANIAEQLEDPAENLDCLYELIDDAPTVSK